MNIAFHRQRCSGQSLIEFLFLLPILLVSTLAIVQLVIVMDRQQKTQTNIWYALRSQTYDSDHAYYNRGHVQDVIKKNFASSDNVTVDFQTKASIVSITALINPFMTPDELEVTVACATPFMFQFSDSYMLQGIFKDVVKDGKITVNSDNQMIRNSVGW